MLIFENTDGEREMNLENVQAGDKLICVTGYGRNREVVIVDRTTKTQIIIGKTRYRKRNGLQLGGGTWSRCHIRPPKEGEVEEVKLERQCQVMRYRIDRMSEGQNLRQLPFESIERIYTAMVTEYDANKVNPS
jgi:hypothetical protein